MEWSRGPQDEVEQMTRVQRTAQILGWILIIVGVLGFFWDGLTTESDVAEAPHLLGLFPVNVWHNLFHLASGIWGVFAARTFSSSRTYARTLGIIYAVLVPLGLITPTLFGIMPIGGNDLWLHALIAIPLLYFGFSARGRAAGGREERERLRRAA
jgi:nicotinamide riboside transporter PnuC